MFLIPNPFDALFLKGYTNRCFFSYFIAVLL